MERLRRSLPLSAGGLHLLGDDVGRFPTKSGFLEPGGDPAIPRCLARHALPVPPSEEGSPLGPGRKRGRGCVPPDQHSYRHPPLGSQGGAPFLAALSVMVGHADIPGPAHRGRIPGAVSKTLGAPRVDREHRVRAVGPVGIRFLPRSELHADRYPHHSGDRSRDRPAPRLRPRLVRPAIGWVRTSMAACPCGRRPSASRSLEDLFFCPRHSGPAQRD